MGSSMKSALTVRVPCQTLVMISGIAVMNTTKIVVAFDTPNQMIAKIAQIADDTVFITGMTGSKNSPSRRLAPNRMPSGRPIAVARMKPAATRPSVMPRLLHRSPLAEICNREFHTRTGPGRM